jgi:apolipoprotein N-acyltransferase
VALVPLLVLARDIGRDPARRVRRGLGWGFLAGFAFFGPLLWFLRPIDDLGWFLLSAIQALSVGLFVAALAAWGERPGRAVAAVVWWIGLEALRSTFPFDGFGWGLLGYTQHDGGPLLPVARVLGVLGVSAVCAAVAVAVEAALARRRAVPLLAAVLAVGLAALTTLVRPPAPTDRTVDIAAVQGTDLQASSAAGVTREDIGRIVRVAEQMVQATRPLADDPPDITVWPENALDADVTDPANEGLRAAVAQALDLLDGGPLLAGMFLRGPEPPTFYNAMVELTPEGIQDVYRKRRPVPFAEYIPARELFDWYPPLGVVGQMLAGDEPGVLDVQGVAVGGVICFENVFPGLVRDQVRDGAELLVVSTNNSSWGRSSASRQHLTYSQLRAVETGRWTLHAGLSGISAVIDPYGRISQRTEIFDETIVRADLPLVRGLTPAMRIGGYVGPAAMLLSAAGLVWLTATRRR